MICFNWQRSKAWNNEIGHKYYAFGTLITVPSIYYKINIQRKEPNTKLFKLYDKLKDMLNLPNLMISIHSKRIQITSNTPPEKSWFLRNYTKLHSQILESYRTNVNTVNKYSPFYRIYQTKKSTYKSCFSTSSSSNNSNLISSWKCTCDSFENKWSWRLIFNLHIY